VTLRSDLPCLWVGARDRQVRVPSEFCQISPDQVFKKKFNENQTRKMVQQATTNTTKRRQDIEEAYR